MKRLSILVLALSVSSAFSMQPPSAADVKRYKADGSYQRRLERCERIGNHRVRPDVAARTIHRLNAATGKVDVNAPLPNWQGMPTTGTNEMLVFLIDFPDHPHSNAATNIEDQIFGAGNPANTPVESLAAYYDRSSYGQLALQGTVLGWYRMAHERSWYTNQYGDGNEANVKIVEEVVDRYDATHDYAQYDNDGDGRIDYFAVIWSGPDTGWSEFWWGYQWSLYSSDLTRDGVRFYDFSWQWEARPVGDPFSPLVLIHETGHALGLPDYYDYDGSVGPDGGVGGLDMMDGNLGCHNAFSKFMLEWLSPTFVASGSQTLMLRPSAQYPEAVATTAGIAGNTAYDEYFMVETRARVENDLDIPTDGLLVWHVDATPNSRGDDFEYDNSYTSHKLLRLMEADGLEEIETGDGQADAGDFYGPGQRFTPGSTPNSTKYDGSASAVNVTNISAAGVDMTATFTIDTNVPVTLNRSPESLSQWSLEGTDAASQQFEVSVSFGSLPYTISETSSFLSVSPTGGTGTSTPQAHTVSYDTDALSNGQYEATITISAAGTVNSPVTLPVTVTIYGTNLPEAVDAPQLSWRTGGYGLWRAQTASAHDGVDAGVSEPITHNQETWLATELEGPGALTFWWKVSSEADYDWLHFYIDDQLQEGSLSGVGEWEYRAFYVGPGPRSVRWSYVKDYSLSAGEDAGWLDQVSWSRDTRDTDADGSLDWEETVAGTIATNAASLPELSDVAVLPGPAGVVLEWPSVSGRTYSVSRAPMPGSPFGAITSGLAATPPMNTYTDATSPATSAFYRVGASIADNSVLLIDESFSSNSVPAGWEVKDYQGDGAVWRFDDPAGRGNRTGGSGAFAIADSDYAGSVWMSTDLWLPVLDFTPYTNVVLQFRHDFTVYFTDPGTQVAPQASVDFQLGTNTWVNVWQRYPEYTPGPVVETIDLTGQLAGRSDVRIAFYRRAYYDWWWQVDDVKIIVSPAP